MKLHENPRYSFSGCGISALDYSMCADNRHSYPELRYYKGFRICVIVGGSAAFCYDQSNGAEKTPICHLNTTQNRSDVAQAFQHSYTFMPGSIGKIVIATSGRLMDRNWGDKPGETGILDIRNATREAHGFF